MSLVLIAVVLFFLHGWKKTHAKRDIPRTSDELPLMGLLCYFNCMLFSHLMTDGFSDLIETMMMVSMACVFIFADWRDCVS